MGPITFVVLVVATLIYYALAIRHDLVVKPRREREKEAKRQQALKAKQLERNLDRVRQVVYRK